jgi:hypothetical protein
MQQQHRQLQANSSSRSTYAHSADTIVERPARERKMRINSSKTVHAYLAHSCDGPYGPCCLPCCCPPHDHHQCHDPHRQPLLL